MIYKCCKECQERHPKCHADCEKKAAEDAEYAKMKEHLKSKETIFAYSREAHERKQEKRRKHQKV